jgi:hypothetical protein
VTVTIVIAIVMGNITFSVALLNNSHSIHSVLKTQIGEAKRGGGLGLERRRGGKGRGGEGRIGLDDGGGGGVGEELLSKSQRKFRKLLLMETL